MPGDWKDFEDWKEKLNESKNDRRDDELDFVDDDVENLTELFREYLDQLTITLYYIIIDIRKEVML